MFELYFQQNIVRCQPKFTVNGFRKFYVFRSLVIQVMVKFTENFVEKSGILLKLSKNPLKSQGGKLTRTTTIKLW